MRYSCETLHGEPVLPHEMGGCLMRIMRLEKWLGEGTFFNTALDSQERECCMLRWRERDGGGEESPYAIGNLDFFSLFLSFPVSQFFLLSWKQIYLRTFEEIFILGFSYLYIYRSVYLFLSIGILCNALSV